MRATMLGIWLNPLGMLPSRVRLSWIVSLSEVPWKAGALLWSLCAVNRKPGWPDVASAGTERQFKLLYTVLGIGRNSPPPHPPSLTRLCGSLWDFFFKPSGAHVVTLAIPSLFTKPWIRQKSCGICET